MLLTGKTTAISGAASERGIGFATARLFAKHGARVAILDLDEAGAGPAAGGAGEGHNGGGGGVAPPQGGNRGGREGRGALGRVDGLAHHPRLPPPGKNTANN